MRSVLAIDPGPEASGVVWIARTIDHIEPRVQLVEHVDNRNLLAIIQSGGYGEIHSNGHRLPDYPDLVIEQIRSSGMGVGAETFDTVHWCGRFQQAWPRPEAVRLIPRIKVKTHHCHTAKATDANIRQALIDRFGKPGTKKNPGPTFGITAHLWAALALAVYAWDEPVD